MSYARDNLIQNESIVLETYGHWINWAAPLLALPAVMVGWIAAWIYAQETLAAWSLNATRMVLLLLIVALSLALFSYLAYIATEFAVTDQRALAKQGLLKTETVEMPFELIETVGIQQSMIGGLFGFGSVVLTGTGRAEKTLLRVPHPAAYRRAVVEGQNRIFRAQRRTTNS